MHGRLLTIALLGSFAIGAAAQPAADCPKELPKAAAKGAETPTDRKFRRELEMVANVEAAWRSCGDVTGFAKTFQPAYDGFQEKYKHAVQRYQQNGEARRYVDCGVDDERRRMQKANESDRKQKADLCRDVMGPGIVRLVTGD